MNRRVLIAWIETEGNLGVGVWVQKNLIARLNPLLIITQKSAQPLLRLQKELRCGRLEKRKNSYQLAFTSKKDLTRILSILKGTYKKEWYTEKWQYFVRWNACVKKWVDHINGDKLPDFLLHALIDIYENSYTQRKKKYSKELLLQCAKNRGMSFNECKTIVSESVTLPYGEPEKKEDSLWG